MFSMFPVLFHTLVASVARLRKEEGQTMAEYGILIAVIAIVVVAAAVLLGGKITGVFNSASNSL